MAKRPLAIISSVIVTLGLLFALYTWFTLSWAYSEGERAGYLQKFSKKGWICKTWEGEILLSSMPGAIPERFTFTVRDDKVAQQMMGAMGKRVRLTYEERKGVPLSCFGETMYHVEQVQVQQ
jgi:hypothetical protein